MTGGTTSEPERTGRPAKRARTRRRLLDAAERTFATRGLDAASIQQVTDEAGLANGTFYNYFETREALVAATAQDLAERFASEIAVSYAEVDDPAERLCLALRRMLDAARADPQLGRLLLQFGSASTPFADWLRDYFRSDLRHGLARERFSALDNAAGVDLVVGAVLAGVRAQLEQRAGRAHASALAALVLRGLGLSERAAEALALRPLAAISDAVASLSPRR